MTTYDLAQPTVFDSTNKLKGKYEGIALRLELLRRNSLERTSCEVRKTLTRTREQIDAFSEGYINLNIIPLKRLLKLPMHK